MDMATWPLFPTIVFGTIQGFFQKLEADGLSVETVTGELNYVFTGCYSSQSRIKRANRLSEERLTQAELLDVMAHSACPRYRTPSPFAPAWRQVLFNQFHDILPGSGVVDTREYAMGEYQKALTTASINGNQAMRSFAAQVDTAAFFPTEEAPLLAAAGVGFGTSEPSGFGFSASAQLGGENRVFTLFNTAQFDRRDVAELTLWDWPGDPTRLRCFDAQGHPLPAQVLESGTHYWGHHFHRVAVLAQAPGFGYTTLGLCCCAPEQVDMPAFPEPRVDQVTDAPVVLENSRLRAAFRPGTLELLSLIEKQSGAELVNPARPSGLFQLVTEETSAGMTAWRVGRHTAVQCLNTQAAVTIRAVTSGPVRQELAFEIPWGNSSLRGTIRLDAESPVLRYDLQVDWREFGSPAGIPQLRFALPLAGPLPTSLCRTPMGLTRRPALAQDVPCLGMLAAETASGHSVALLSDCKYGFRNDGAALGLTLLRSSYDPRPHARNRHAHHVSCRGSRCGRRAPPAGTPLRLALDLRVQRTSARLPAAPGAVPPGRWLPGIRRQDSGGWKRPDPAPLQPHQGPSNRLTALFCPGCLGAAADHHGDASPDPLPLGGANRADTAGGLRNRHRPRGAFLR